jgi:uncharacterized membrane protein
MYSGPVQKLRDEEGEMADAALPAAAIPELTQDEKAYAGLAHALMMGTWWVGPLVIYLTKKESRFVAFHSLQALFWQIIFTVLYVGVMVVFAAILLVATLAANPSNSSPNQSLPIAFFILFPIMWLFVLGAMAITFTLGIMYCLKGMRGEWAGYPVIGDWARKIVCG